MDQFHSKDFTLIVVLSAGSDKNDTGTETWPDQPFIYKQEIYLHAKNQHPRKIVLHSLLYPDLFLLEVP